MRTVTTLTTLAATAALTLSALPAATAAPLQPVPGAANSPGTAQSPDTTAASDEAVRTASQLFDLRDAATAGERADALAAAQESLDHLIPRSLVDALEADLGTNVEDFLSQAATGADLGALQNEWASTYTDVFGGVWLDDAGAGHVGVAPGDDADELRDAVTEAGYTPVDVDDSLRELDQRQGEAWQTIAGLPEEQTHLITGVHVDPVANDVVVTTYDGPSDLISMLVEALMGLASVETLSAGPADDTDESDDADEGRTTVPLVPGVLQGNGSQTDAPPVPGADDSDDSDSDEGSESGQGTATGTGATTATGTDEGTDTDDDDSESATTGTDGATGTTTTREPAGTVPLDDAPETSGNGSQTDARGYATGSPDAGGDINLIEELGAMGVLESAALNSLINLLSGTGNATGSILDGMRAAAPNPDRTSPADPNRAFLPVPEGDVYGGTAYDVPSQHGILECSTGFNGTLDGEPVSITAAHCSNGEDSRASFPGPAGQEFGTFVNVRHDDIDSALLRADEEYADRFENNLVGTEGGGTQEITGTADPVVGMEVCKTGARTGYSCGTVTAVGEQIDVAGDRQLSSGLIVDVCALPGDSGGVVFAGDRAVGISSASNVAGSHDCAAADADATDNGDVPRLSAVPINHILASHEGLELNTG